MIVPIVGDDLGVKKNSNYRLVEWNQCGRIVFSLTRQGDAMTCHFGAERKSLRYIKTVFNEFVRWIFDQYNWCKMIIATIIKEKPSIVRVLEKCDFRHIQTISSGHIYARLRHG